MNQIPVAPQYIKDFEQLGFGMFVHFGLYSQLNKGEWVYHIHKLDMKEYSKLIDTFQVGSMKEIVATAKSAGCTYQLSGFGPPQPSRLFINHQAVKPEPETKSLTSSFE